MLNIPDETPEETTNPVSAMSQPIFSPAPEKGA